MTDLAIREMTAGDIAAIFEIEKASFLTPWPETAFVEELANAMAVYAVAELEGAAIGYAGMWIILDEAHIMNVAVADAQCGRGIGKALMRRMIEWAKERGALSMTLEVRPSNDSALALYEGFGFVRAGVRKNYYEDSHEDAIIMWLEKL